jgi:hypothetical protein
LKYLSELRTALWHLRAGGTRQFRQWRLRKMAEEGHLVPENVRGVEGGWTGRRRSRSLSFTPFAYPDVPPRRDDVTVGVILDEFSSRAFGYEWNVVPLGRESWKEELSLRRVDFVFIESAWNGNDGDWKYQLSGASGPKAPILELLAWCRAQGIPSVFWNKEDPPHYQDFLPLAREFDVVLTSDANRIDDYRRDLGHERIFAMSFAAQPALHNPVRPRHGLHSRGVAFAGMYFAHKYPERRSQLNILLEGAADAEKQSDSTLEIFSRHLGGDPNYQFPEPFDKAVVGSLSYSQMLTAYRAYKVFLNVNSVVDSPTMCARRIFEITASGTPVISTPSEAIPNFFGPDEIFVAGSAAEASSYIRAISANPELGDRAVHRAQRRVWSGHTYAHRAESVLSLALPERSRPVRLPTASALVSTIRPTQLDHVFAAVGRQQDVDLELVLLTHGFEVERRELDRLREQHGVEHLTLLTAPKERQLGECLNDCVEAASGEVLSKMDDDDIYGDRYMPDLLYALQFSRADIVGKHAHYMYLAGSDVTVLRFAHKEHRPSRMVMGPTVTGSRDIFRSHPFAAVTRGEDTDFLTRVSASGGYIYSADRYNYCQVRHGGGHTWTISDTDLLASGEIKFFGRPENHITV